MSEPMSFDQMVDVARGVITNNNELAIDTVGIRINARLHRFPFKDMSGSMEVSEPETGQFMLSMMVDGEVVGTPMLLVTDDQPAWEPLTVEPRHELMPVFVKAESPAFTGFLGECVSMCDSIEPAAHRSIACLLLKESGKQVKLRTIHYPTSGSIQEAARKRMRSFFAGTTGRVAIAIRRGLSNLDYDIWTLMVVEDTMRIAVEHGPFPQEHSPRRWFNFGEQTPRLYIEMGAAIVEALAKGKLHELELMMAMPGDGMMEPAPGVRVNNN